MQIPLSEFEEHIDTSIKNRGLSYFAAGYVKEPEEISSGKFEAVVEGTENYTVELEIKDGFIIDYACNCPYDWGPVCKHIVALIFYLKQAEFGPEDKTGVSVGFKKTKKRKTVSEQVRELLEIVSHDELKEFVYKNTVNNTKFRHIFLSSFAHHNNDESKELYKKQIKSLLEIESRSDGYIDWKASRRVADFANSLLNLAQKQASLKNYSSSLFICEAIIEEMLGAFEYSDDSSGYMSGALSSAIELLSEIAKEDLSEDIRKAILNHCFRIIKGSAYWGWDWYFDLLQLAISLVQTDDEIQWIIFYLDQVAEEGSRYAREEAQSIKHSIIQQIEGEEKADKYLEQNMDNSRFRKKIITKALEKKDYQKASSIALDGVAYYEANGFRSVYKWYNLLLKIAQAAKDKEKIIKYARWLFVDNYSHEQEYYQILKENVLDCDWNIFMEDIIKEISKNSHWQNISLIADIYIYEKMWPRLFELVKQSPDLSTIKLYEKHLAKDYTSELVELYSEAILQYLKNNMGRSYYKDACRYLRRIIKLGNREKATEVMEILRKTYPRRRALLEELDKV